MSNQNHPGPQWLRSSYCDGGQCVEVAQLPHDRVAVRQTTDPQGKVLTLSAREWAAFLAALRAGEITP
jgi:uncharacterized protein DUF397